MSAIMPIRRRPKNRVPSTPKKMARALVPAQKLHELVVQRGSVMVADYRAIRDAASRLIRDKKNHALATRLGRDEVELEVIDLLVERAAGAIDNYYRGGSLR